MREIFCEESGNDAKSSYGSITTYVAETRFSSSEITGIGRKGGFFLPRCSAGFVLLVTTTILVVFSTCYLRYTPRGEGTQETLAASAIPTMVIDRFEVEVSHAYTTKIWKIESKLKEDSTSLSLEFLEPYRMTTFSLKGLDNANFHLELESSHAAPSTASGRGDMEGTVALYFNRVGRSSIKFRVLSLRSIVVEYERDIVLKYVRREIRRILDEDRTALFTAMEIVYTMPTRDGLEKYGSSFRGIAYFMTEHLKAAAAKECDHWHDGAGMISTHIAYTLEFEQALQVVDPTVSLPYWDFTIDDKAYGTNWTLSPLFSDEWFGPIPKNPNHGAPIPSGRWAYLRLAPLSDVAIADRSIMEMSFTNTFGLLRSPWNSNPSPFVTRMFHVVDTTPFTNLPGCALFHSALQLDSLASFNEALNGATHGTVHVVTGGLWDVNISAMNSVGWQTHREQFLLMAKQLWRMGYVRCDRDEFSDANENGDRGRSNNNSTCYCPSAYRANSGKSSLDILNKTGLLHWLSIFAMDIPKNAGVGAESGDYDENSQKWDTLLDTFCSVGHAGDMFTSASPADPLFWVVHPALDRLLAWRRLLSNGDRPFDETWGYSHNRFTASDTDAVCDWSNVTGMGLPHCQPGTCAGHKRETILPFTIKNQTSFSVSGFYEFMHPGNIDFPYSYDDYEWEHCEALGYAMK